MRVLQIGLGPLGVRIAADVERRGLGQVVAAIDPAPKVAGPAELRVLASLDELAEPVDVAVVATVSSLEGCAPTLLALARRGISAVSTCEELSWPWVRHPELARALDAAAIAGGARLLGTGVNPGFVMDALAIAVTTACAAVRRVEIHRIQDASTRRIPFQQKIGAGLTVEEFAARAADGRVRHVGLAESVHMCAAALGFAIARVDETIGPVLADGGGVRGVHQEAHAFEADGTERISLIFRAALGEADPRDAIRVDGDPPVDLVIRNGLHGDVATSAVVLNSIRSLLAARPGLHTMITLPLAGCARG